MGGRFDVARTRLVQAGPASDELDHFQHGLVNGLPELQHDRHRSLSLLLFTPKHRFVGFMNLSPSYLYPPT